MAAGLWERVLVGNGTKDRSLVPGKDASCSSGTNETTLVHVATKTVWQGPCIADLPDYMAPTETAQGVSHRGGAFNAYSPGSPTAWTQAWALCDSCGQSKEIEDRELPGAVKNDHLPGES